jgi:ABC-type multidrug transport system fused ATPase/permease subunit
VSNPSILILDEATSSIDSYSEELIQRATETITQGRTSIVIAHRLATIINADKIVVMDGIDRRARNTSRITEQRKWILQELV